MTAPTPNGFVPSGFFALRTPLLPFDELLAWSEGLSAREAARQGDLARLEAALAADRALLRERLQAALARPEVREALFLASPSLDESHGSWRKAPESERGQKVERALVRYWSRLAGRATPFGLFAGCSVGHLDAATRLALAGRERYQRHARLDMDYVCTLAERLAALPGLREELLYHPNSSLYRAGGRLRYAESRLQGRTRTYHLVAVEPTDYLEATLTRARSGASPRTLAQALADADPDVPLEDAEAYVGELISSQLLVPELTPAVTGPEPIHDLLARLRPFPAAAGVHQRLEEARQVLEELKQLPPGVDPERYRALARGLETLPAPVELSRMFQVDMVKPAAELKLGPGPVEELTRAVRLLHRLHPAQEPLNLRTFREAFQQRYGEREVPLVEVLDEEAGIGFEQEDVPAAEASPLLEGLVFPAMAPEERVAWGVRQQYLQRRLVETLRTGARELVLDENDLKALETRDAPPLPDAFAVMATLLAPSEEALGTGDFQVLVEAVVGPSGAKLLGRFCHADPELHRHVEAHLRAEEALRPEVLHAELVHQPEGRVGNILSRPVLRGHEIVFLGRSGAEPERRIPITDLRVSIQGRRIVLRSASLGREVLPRLTNAHNFVQAHLRLYRFLATLQQQGSASGMKWRWGALETSPFLPRVVTGRLILQLARWRLPAASLAALGEVHGGERFQAVQRLRDELGLPRFVGVTDSDNVLPVDLDNVLSVETFVHLVKGREHVELVELPAEARCVRGPEGSFVNEVVVPFVRTERPAAAAPLVRSAPLPRSFAPGSEWLYAKLYTGTATADRVLLEAVAPLMREALASGAADHGFFIRYGDPDWHVRMRLHGPPTRLRGEVLGRLYEALAPLQHEGLVWRVQLDTYEREVERYGGPEAMLLAERLFHVDSEAVLELLELYSSDADARWRTSLLGVDALLGDLGMDLEAKRRVMGRLREGYGREFRVDVAFERQLGEKFREHRKELEALLVPGSAVEDALAPAREVLRRRSERSAPWVGELRAREAEGKLLQGVEQLAESHVHMHVNRMLRTAARAQELVLYDLLHRLYESRAARQRRGTAQYPR
ncbi:hypothetical protein BO221_49945 [Archangium sp. Cb G35]|nr:hypothetical protein BO221_49945 [Archangium sp. Cb G35]